MTTVLLLSPSEWEDKQEAVDYMIRKLAAEIPGLVTQHGDVDRRLGVLPVHMRWAETVDSTEKHVICCRKHHHYVNIVFIVSSGLPATDDAPLYTGFFLIVQLFHEIETFLK